MSYNERMRVVLEQIGLDARRELPKEGMLPIVVNDPTYGKVRVWIIAYKEPATYWAFGRSRKVKSSAHRVMCECPHCHTEMSLGRLHQHVNTVTCTAIQLGIKPREFHRSSV